jgi:pyruvate dehydrogenase E1 component beta subunit
VTSETPTATPASADSSAPRILRYRNALNEALDHLLATDDRVVLLGEDICDPGGGAMQVTAGLSTKYGTERVRETPISEQAIIGAAIGAALGGLRPIPEIMMMDFTAVCMDQIVNHAAKLRYMSGGRTSVPMTIRTMVMAGNGMGGQHAQSLEAWMLHTPGLRVVAPSTPADAKGLLLACARSDDPTIFMETASLYTLKGPVPEGPYEVPLGVADVKRTGRDVSVITYGATVHLALAAASALDGEIDVEVVDLRSLNPLDEATLLASVTKTGRAVVVHQAVRTCGFGAELAARIQEQCWSDLSGPVRRVAAPDTPAPYAKPLETAYLPSATDIVEACRLAFKGGPAAHQSTAMGGSR